MFEDKFRVQKTDSLTVTWFRLRYCVCDHFGSIQLVTKFTRRNQRQKRAKHDTFQITPTALKHWRAELKSQHNLGSVALGCGTEMEKRQKRMEWNGNGKLSECCNVCAFVMGLLCVSLFFSRCDNLSLHCVRVPNKSCKKGPLCTLSEVFSVSVVWRGPYADHRQNPTTNSMHPNILIHFIENHRLTFPMTYKFHANADHKVNFGTYIWIGWISANIATIDGAYLPLSSSTLGTRNNK